jgi:ABC-type phosphate/phosphonate transport system substrate-binding protein
MRLALGTAWLAPSAGSAAAPVAPHQPIRVGIVRSLFRDMPERLVLTLMQPFGGLMKAETGLDCDLVPGGTGLELGKQLAENKLDVALFQGIEFAWARQKYPDLRPLMLVVNQKPHYRAYLVVGKNAGIKDLADLRGKTLALPLYSHEHCYQFLDRLCRPQHKTPQQFFDKIARPPDVETALDDAVDGKVPAALIDQVPLDCYRRRKPGRYVGLTILKRSEVFPASVVAYRAGRLDRALLDRFRNGMKNARRTAIGRQLLSLWLLTGFEDAPKDFQASLEKIVRLYPAPQPTDKASARVTGTGKGERRD